MGNLQRLLLWMTGSDVVEEGVEVTVVPTQTAAHLPSAATCSRELRLPAMGGSDDDDDGVHKLEMKLVHAMNEGANFGDK